MIHTHTHTHTLFSSSLSLSLSTSPPLSLSLSLSSHSLSLSRPKGRRRDARTACSCARGRRLWQPRGLCAAAVDAAGAALHPLSAGKPLQQLRWSDFANREGEEKKKREMEERERKTITKDSHLPSLSSVVSLVSAQRAHLLRQSDCLPIAQYFSSRAKGERKRKTAERSAGKTVQSSPFSLLHSLPLSPSLSSAQQRRAVDAVFLFS